MAEVRKFIGTEVIISHGKFFERLQISKGGRKRGDLVVGQDKRVQGGKQRQVLEARRRKKVVRGY